MYDWKDKEADCYRLYVDEQKSLEEVVEYWRERGFEPSKRAFQTQFKRWKFPSKHNQAAKHPGLVDRIKQLWDQNKTQKEILQGLRSEGYAIAERELIRIRAKNRWLLRVRNPTAEITQNKDPHEGAEVFRELEQAVMNANSATNVDQVAMTLASHKTTQAVPEISEAQAKAELEQLMQKRQAESDEKWRTRKRRRRTKGWAGLPADPVGVPPRFPSETTLDESKAYLNLDNKTYTAMRDQFMSMCEAEGIIKKTLAGPEKWEAIKARLIRENEHLTRVYWGAPPNRTGDQRDLSLDVICMDVTKRMRVMRTRMSLAQAKNILNVNPTESRDVRSGFRELVTKAHFESKLQSEGTKWEDLKRELMATSPVLQKRLAGGTSDPQYELKLKALEIVCRDVMKRVQEERKQAEPSRITAEVYTTPGPGPAKARHLKDKEPVRPTSKNRNAANASTNMQQSAVQYSGPSHHDLQIDPSLLLAASGPSLTVHDSRSRPQASDATPEQQPNSNEQATIPSAAPIPAYFRLHPMSPLQATPQLWLDVLRSGTVDEIHQLAIQKHPGARILGVEGVVKDQRNGMEIRYTIDEEAELSGYLAHVAGGKVTLVVKLA